MTPNIHVTCVSRDRLGLRKMLVDLHALGIENVFAMTGDFPKSTGPNRPSPVFDLDSVNLVSLISELRQAGMSFWTAVAVSPFKYTEADCDYQYLKLEKKIAAGADYAITQVGYDVRKFQELKRYLEQREIRIPVVGNVYVLNLRAAEKMAKGEPPGCWVSPELLDRVRKESQVPDKGLVARLERAARMVAILRGLGYAGAYLGGTHDAEHIRWITRRSEALFSRWQEFAEELTYAPKGGFYFYDPPPCAPIKSGLIPRVLGLLARLFPVYKENSLRRCLTAFFRWMDGRPALARGLERLEFAIKSPLFGCQACGNCVLSHMEYVCPQTCPKGMRNGPCGGTHCGQCEVVDQRCIWVSVYERAKAANRVESLKIYIPPEPEPGWNHLLD